MKYGLSESTVEKIRGVFAQFPEIEKVVLYGSRAKGNFKTGSDIDLTLYGAALTSDLHATIADKLDDLLLPYSIDLSLFDELDHAKLREHIERVGVVFYERVNQGAGMKAGWKEKSVGEILRLEYGKPLDDTARKSDGLYPVYGANGEKARSDKFYFDKPSIIVGRKGSAGEVNLTGEKFWPLDVTYFVVFDEQQYDLRFLFYLLKTLDLPSLAKGVKPGINRNEVYSRFVKIPTLPEQQRIVAILDEAFDGIATAKANAEKNIQNARAIFESYLSSVFSQRGDGWIDNKKPLADLCDLIVDCEHKTAPMQEEGIPSIRTPNIGKNKLLLDGVYRVSDETYREWTRRAEPLSGDLIFAREAPAGNVAVIPENLKVCLGQRTVLIRPSRNVFIPEFLALTLLQPKMQQKLLDHSRGATVQHVNMKDIRALNVGGVPSLSVQRDIVSVVAKASQESERLESIYRQKSAALDELKKSLLHQAFSGQL